MCHMWAGLLLTHFRLGQAAVEVHSPAAWLKPRRFILSGASQKSKHSLYQEDTVQRSRWEVFQEKRYMVNLSSEPSQRKCFCFFPVYTMHCTSVVLSLDERQDDGPILKQHFVFAGLSIHADRPWLIIRSGCGSRYLVWISVGCSHPSCAYTVLITVHSIECAVLYTVLFIIENAWKSIVKSRA